MPRSFRKRVGYVALTLVGVVAAIGVWFFQPWLDHDPWRWFLAARQEWRADHFSHWERVSPYRTVEASSTPREYARDLEDLGAVRYSLDEREFSIDQYLERADVAGLMVLSGGKVRYEAFAQGIDADSRFQIWSATKSFTSTLVAMALFEGKIESLDDPAQRYAVQFEGTAYGETSLRHLLMMSSGIDFAHFNHDPDRNDMYWAVIQRGQDLDDWAAELGRDVPPGSNFNYLATDTHVLGAVLRGAYGQPLATILQERLWERGGFSAAATWAQHAEGDAGHAFGHCCLAMRLQDFAHLGQLYLEDLVLGGTQTVPDDWFEMVANPHAPFQEPRVNPESGSVRMGYSFQFWLPPDHDNEFVASGAFGQELWIDRSRGFVVAQFATSDTPSGEYVAAMRALGDAVVSSREEQDPTGG